ncbi:hypothetical protein OHS03_32345 [Nocardia salmonicida]|nr:hypothetical protein [Nocardia salmonicida]
MPARLQCRLDTPCSRTGERLDTDIELEFPIEEHRSRSGGGDLGRQVGTEFGDGATDYLACDFARRRRRDIAERAGPPAQHTTDCATDRTTESRQKEIGHPELLARAVTVGDLDHPGREIDTAFFQSFESRAAQRESGRGLGSASGEHAGDELFDRYPNRNLRGDPGRDTGDRTDTGPRGGQRDSELDRGHDHRADDHEFGVLDVVGAVVQELGLLLTPRANRGEGGLITGQELVAEGRDRGVGFTFGDCG